MEASSEAVAKESDGIEAGTMTDKKELFAALIKGMQQQLIFLSQLRDSTIEFHNTDFKKMYKKYADNLEVNELTPDQRKQAIMNHVLNQLESQDGDK